MAQDEGARKYVNMPERLVIKVPSGVHARHDAAGVTENREALGSADRPQALSKKAARGDRAVVCQLGLNHGGQWPSLHSPSSRAAVAWSRFRFGAAVGCSGSDPMISTSSMFSDF